MYVCLTHFRLGNLSWEGLYKFIGFFCMKPHCPRVTSFLAVRQGEILWYDILHYTIFIIFYISSHSLAWEPWLNSNPMARTSAVLSSFSEKLEVIPSLNTLNPCQGHTGFLISSASTWVLSREPSWYLVKLVLRLGFLSSFEDRRQEFFTHK